MRRVALQLLLAAMSVLPSTTHALPPIPDGYGATELSSMPDTRLEYYFLDAVSTTGLLKQLNERGPIDSHRIRRYALASWTINYAWKSDHVGAPDFGSTACSFRASVSLPKWAPLEQPQAKLIESWKRFTQAIGAHEAGHLKHALVAKDQVCAKIIERSQTGKLSITEAHQIANRELNLIRAGDVEYDRMTDHGASQGVRLQ